MAFITINSNLFNFGFTIERRLYTCKMWRDIW